MFKSLVCAVSEQCQEIKQAIALFPYFDSWNANTIAECCRVSSLSEFPPEAIILGPGTGDSHAVHFILDGICRMVHHLRVELTTDSREERIHKLYKLTDSRTPNSEKPHQHYLSRLFNQNQSLPDEEKDPGSCPAASTQKVEGMEMSNDDQRREAISGNDSETEVVSLEKEHGEKLTPEAFPAKVEAEISVSEKKMIFGSDRHLKILQECKEKRAEVSCVLEKRTLREGPLNARSLFIETGSLLSGASFGLGKLGRENFVMSSTQVKILKIPLRFLLQYNPCNIWNKISLFQSLYLFQDDEIFEHFKNHRKWIEEKKKQTEEIVSLKNIPNHTLIGDVPYWIRLSSPSEATDMMRKRRIGLRTHLTRFPPGRLPIRFTSALTIRKARKACFKQVERNLTLKAPRFV